MDFEKAIQALVEGDIKAQKRADRADERADRADERADRADERMDKFDKQLRATANLVRAGMKMLMDDRKQAIADRKERKELDREFNFKLKALIDAQNRTDDKFNRWIEELRKNRTNGHS